MEINDNGKFLEIAKKFNIKGNITKCNPYGNGHINSTFLVVAENESSVSRYILQSVNTNVFKKPHEVMSNVLKVTKFLREKSNTPENIMALIPTLDGNAFFEGDDGNFWRVYSFVENSICLDLPETEEDFYQSAVAFGEFQRLLDDFPVDELFETIPNFHNTPKRFNDFLEAIKEIVIFRSAYITIITCI